MHSRGASSHPRLAGQQFNADGVRADALQQALYTRRARREDELVHHSHRSYRQVSIRYAERLVEAGIEPQRWNGSRGLANIASWSLSAPAR